MATTRVIFGDVIVVDHLAQTASKLASAPKDLRVAHLNIRSIRNKMEELRTLQHVCNFDIIGITETHLNKSVSDNGLTVFRETKRNETKRNETKQNEK